MKRLLYWLGLVTLVWTEDIDGDLRLRIVRYDLQTGDRYVYAILGPTTAGHPKRLLPSGEVARSESDNYVRRWYPYAEKPRKLQDLRQRLSLRKPKVA